LELKIISKLPLVFILKIKLSLFLALKIISKLPLVFVLKIKKGYFILYIPL
jgi:hypothetical protein